MRSAISADMLLGTAGAAFPWHAWKKSGILTSGVLGYYYNAAYTTLFSFSAPPAGGEPKGGLLSANGALIGTTSTPATAFALAGGTEVPFATLANGANQSLSVLNATTLIGVEPNDVFTLTYDSTTHSFNQTVIYAFTGGPHGSAPTSPLLVAPACLTTPTECYVYGTASGGANGGGIVYYLHLVGKQWRQVVVNSFTTGGAGGSGPSGALVFGKVHNYLYGTTTAGGAYGGGVLYSLVLSGTGTEKVLHSFGAGSDGAQPSGLTLDSAYNLYGTTAAGGAGFGTIYKLTAKATPVYSQIYTFVNAADGETPYGALAIDAGGALYGTSLGGINGQGVNFILEPPTTVKHPQWTMNPLHSFGGTVGVANTKGDDGAVPSGKLILDTSGTIYGVTTFGGSYGYGTVYSVAPGSPNYASVHHEAPK